LSEDSNDRNSTHRPMYRVRLYQNQGILAATRVKHTSVDHRARSFKRILAHLLEVVLVQQVVMRVFALGSKLAGRQIKQSARRWPLWNLAERAKQI
jgi:hypothetical protein